jgi:hypothetical protein
VRLLGIDAAPDELRIATGERIFGTVRLTGLARIPVDSPGALAAVLRGLAGPRRPLAFAALPAAAVAHRRLVLPFRDRRRLAATVPLELLGQLPADVESPVVAFVPLGDTAGGGTAVLAAAARGAARDAATAPLDAAGLAPGRLDVAPLPVWNLIAHADAALVLADGARSALAVRRGGRPTALRALAETPADAARFAAEVRWSLSALGGVPGAVVLAGADAGPALADALAAATGTAVTSLRRAGGPPAPDGPLDACAVAAGLVLGAARGAAPALDLSRTTPRTPVRHVAVLAAAVAALVLVDWGLARWELVRRADRLEAAVRREAAAALPGVPPGEARETLAAAVRARDRARTGGALALLREIALRAPATPRVELDDIALDGETLRLRGRSPSFDGVEALRRALAASPLLADVVAEETRAAVDGRKVEFRLRATRRLGETPS